MSGAVRITRLDLSAADLRRLSKKQKNPLMVLRMLAIALVLEGADRQTAARACGMDRQTLRDWVHRYNAEGVAGLRERRTSGNKSPLGATEKQALAALAEAGPDPAVHKVVRWRRVDLQKELKTRFGVEVHERTVGKFWQPSATAACRCVRSIPNPTCKPKRLLKKLFRNPGQSTPGSGPWQAR